MGFEPLIYGSIGPAYSTVLHRYLPLPYFIYLFIDIFKEGSLISDPALLSIRALYIQNTNTTRFKNYKQDTLEYIPNGKITKNL